MARHCQRNFCFSEKNAIILCVTNETIAELEKVLAYQKFIPYLVRLNKTPTDIISEFMEVVEYYYRINLILPLNHDDVFQALRHFRKKEKRNGILSIFRFPISLPFSIFFQPFSSHFPSVKTKLTRHYPSVYFSSPLVVDDPSDDIFFACALSAGASLIISGDKHLLKFVTFQGIPVVTPAQFLKNFKKGDVASR